MDPIAKTAYYCCGVRAADAAGPDPICGDTFAQRFMTTEAMEIFSRFADLTMPNRSNVTRARIIDDWIRAGLKQNPRQLVITLGAGFDTRPYRLTGGSWVELDHPSIIAAKEAALATTESANPLQRVAIDFARDRLADALSPWSGERQALVVMEGVSMYLTQNQLNTTLATLRQHLPGHTLFCDLMTRTFQKRFGGPIGERIGELGGAFAPLVDDPAATVIAAGYEQRENVSIVGRARELGAVRLPRLLLNTLLRGLRDGYSANQFEAKT
jgi:methyltransferase (TIGR00027 family)